jgi:hypothetical protein
VASATGNADGLAFIASPAYAIRLGTYRTVVGDDVQIWPSAAVADGVLIAVQTKAFVSGFGAVPRINTAQDAVVQWKTPPRRNSAPSAA